MLCKCHWIVLYTVHFTAFCLGGGGVFFPDMVYLLTVSSIRTISQHDSVHIIVPLCGVHAC